MAFNMAGHDNLTARMLFSRVFLNRGIHCVCAAHPKMKKRMNNWKPVFGKQSLGVELAWGGVLGL